MALFHLKREWLLWSLILCLFLPPLNIPSQVQYHVRDEAVFLGRAT
jgi:hypothetical protein